MPDIHESSLTQLPFSSEIKPELASSEQPSENNAKGPRVMEPSVEVPELSNDLWARIMSLTAPVPAQMMPVHIRQVSKSWLQLYDVCLKANIRQLNKDAVFPDQPEDYELVVSPQGDYKIEDRKIYLSQLQGKIAYALRTPDEEEVKGILDLEVPNDRPLSEMVLQEHEIAIWHLLTPYTQSQKAVIRQQAEVDYILQHEQDILRKIVAHSHMRSPPAILTPPPSLTAALAVLKVPRDCQRYFNYMTRESLLDAINSTVIQCKILTAIKYHFTYLALNECRLTRFPRSVFYDPQNSSFWSELTSLNLEGNRLTQLPPEIEILRKLKSLNVENNELKWVPQQLGNLTTLRNLDLSQNRLQKIPVELGKLSMLFELNLRWNQIEELPSEIGNLQNLHMLLLQANRLLSLPSELGNCKQLRTLDVQSNFLQTLPEEIAALPNVHLYLGDNRLRSLPEAFNKSSFRNRWGNSYSQEEMLAEQQRTEVVITALEVGCSRCTLS